MLFPPVDCPGLRAFHIRYRVRLAIIEDGLNAMPRKLHDWDSARSVYTSLSRNTARSRNDR